MMAGFSINGDELRDGNNRKVGSVRNGMVYDSRNGKVASIRGDSVYDAHNSKVASIRSGSVYDKTNRKIATTKDVAKEIKGGDDEIAVAFWLCFVRRGL